MWSARGDGGWAWRPGSASSLVLGLGIGGLPTLFLLLPTLVVSNPVLVAFLVALAVLATAGTALTLRAPGRGARWPALVGGVVVRTVLVVGGCVLAVVLFTISLSTLVG